MNEEQVQEVVEASQPSEIETEARVQGWVPKEEFRGDEKDWIEAEVFVQRGREINPILRKNNERITKELDATKRQMEELKQATEEFKKFQKESFERKLQEYETEIQDLKALKRKAISEGDGELVVELDDRIDEIKTKKSESQEVSKEKKSEVPATDPKVQAEIEQWVSENPWYKTDTKLATATNALADQIRKNNPYLVGKEFLDLVDKELSELFPPEKLGKKTRPRSPVEGVKGGSESKGGKNSYDSLPPEAKSACDKFVKQKLMSRDEYIKMYFE